jgi:thymidylate synthase (FAD)
VDVVKKLVAGQAVRREDTTLSPREWRELMASLGRPAD